ncbi:sortase [Tessaracoccus sp. OS52]|uniref:sortase n=1 Tax=Tessaracoccus sp. OS52 TaxID=2886691 RepID=UPI00272A3CE3|nr:class E sortase [Tessaracoccus sp. OS52]
MPPPPRPKVPLGPRELLIRGWLVMVVVVLLGFLTNLMLLSHLQHVVAQHQLRATFAEQLAAGTAPVSEGTFEDVLLRDGEPVARLEIPAIGLDQIVVEGTTSGVLTDGPGHRRDTSLPGQAGVSVLMGRGSAYGAPFSRIPELAPGEEIKVVTGQGEHTYEVIGVRYAGDLAPPPVKAGQSRLILVTTRGMPYMPSGLARVDAQLVSDVQAPGLRDTTFRSLQPEHKELAGDARTVWALVFALQLLVAAEIAAVLCYRRVGFAKAWVVFMPVLVLTGLLVGDQITLLMPNLL